MYLLDQKQLPHQAYGTWKTSALVNQDLKLKICTHPQSASKYVRAQDIVAYMQDTNVQRQFGLKKGVSLATAKVWMVKLNWDHPVSMSTGPSAWMLSGTAKRCSSPSLLHTIYLHVSGQMAAPQFPQIGSSGVTNRRQAPVHTCIVTRDRPGRFWAGPILQQT